MINDPTLKNILATADDWSVVAEFYHQDTVPTDDGFDPADALWRIAAVADVMFLGQVYEMKLSGISNISRSIGKTADAATVTIANIDRKAAAFDLNGPGFEGLIMVIRGFSRSQSDTLAKSKIEFVGRCEKPDGGSKASLSVNAKFVVGAADVRIPWRKFGPDDLLGRDPSDPEFEGFRFMPQYGSVSYIRIEKRGGFLGWWNKKTVRATTQWSSYSNLDAQKPVPLAYGLVQAQGVLIGAADVGAQLQMRVAFCEGEIEGYQNIRSDDPGHPIIPTTMLARGLPGVMNGDDPSYVAPGWYSRTAEILCYASGYAVDEANEAAPGCVSIIRARKILTPDAAGNWTVTQWDGNAAAIVRDLLTHPRAQNLHPNWLDTASLTEFYNYNAEWIFDMSINEYVFVERTV